MRLIDAETLMPLFIKKAYTIKDRHGVRLGEEWLLNCNEIKDVIDNAPTVEPKKIEYKAYNDGFKDGVDQGIKLSERAQGEWIEVKADISKGIEYHIKCSNCGAFGLLNEDRHYYFSDYCPFCGADMKGDT